MGMTPVLDAHPASRTKQAGKNVFIVTPYFLLVIPCSGYSAFLKVVLHYKYCVSIQYFVPREFANRQLGWRSGTTKGDINLRLNVVFGKEK